MHNVMMLNVFILNVVMGRVVVLIVFTESYNVGMLNVVMQMSLC